MSLMKSLARVAAGVIVAKGIGSVMQQSQGGGRNLGNRRTGGGILGDLLNGMGGAQSGNANGYGRSTGGTGGSVSGSTGGGWGDVLGQVLGGRQAGNPGTGRPYGGPNSRGAQGGLGGILDGLSRQHGTTSASTATGGMGGGLGGLLGGLAGGAAAGGLGGMLGGLLNGPAQRGAQDRNDASFGEVFNDALARGDEPEVAPTPEQNAVAGLMLRAMIMAAKADGHIDEAERERLMGQVGDLDDEDRRFIKEQMAAPVDPQALAREVPKGLEAQVYMMSLMAVDLDSEQEARYLARLSQALGLNAQQTNDIHQQVGVQNLYS